MKGEECEGGMVRKFRVHSMVESKAWFTICRKDHNVTFGLIVACHSEYKSFLF